MGAKKKLLGRMAQWTGFAFVLAAVVGLFAALVDLKAARRFSEERQSEERQRVEESRAYLAALAKRIDKLPVDPTLAYEVESRYFEERARGPVYVWAMDTNGGFVFGVPQPAFDKLNAIYDREVTPRLKEGVFLDRQSFLLGFIDDHANLGAEALSGDDRVIPRGERWRLDQGDPHNAVVLSTPLKTTTGAAIGSLYLKQMPNPRPRYRDDDQTKAVMAAGGIVALVSFLFLWLLLPTWVYVDARERGVRRAPLFAFLTVLSSLVGLVVYLISRPENMKLTCPGCSREVDGGAFCPHCGRDLSRSICPACRYPLQAEWAYCPACRTETKAAVPAAAVPEAG